MSFKSKILTRQYGQDMNIWDLLSGLFLFVLFLLQAMRWSMLPQFMDVFHHLISAWGFIQAGGYSGWDFWQYAPFGRPNIYPPLFHILLALLMKLGFGAMFLAKSFEIVTPVIFLIVLWQFIRKNFSQAQAFFTLVAFGSAFSFHRSLINHIPSTLALTLGILAIGRVFKGQVIRASILIALCFYSHIGVSWFIVLGLIFYAFLDKQTRKVIFPVLLYSVILSLPMFLKQILALNAVNITGAKLGENFSSQVKLIDYFLAAGGLYLVFKERGKYYLFLGYFLAGFLFLPYLYRFFSCEGYLPVILLSGFFLSKLWQKCRPRSALKKVFILLTACLLFLSPVLSFEKVNDFRRAVPKIKLSDSVLTNMLLAKGATVWYPQDYLPAVHIIKSNSKEGDIIFSNMEMIGAILGSIAGRPTSNALLTEVAPSQKFDPIPVSKIIIFTKDLEGGFLAELTKAYKLEKIGETKIFNLYKNPSGAYPMDVRKAALPFWAILLMFAFLGTVFWLFKLKISP